MSSSPEMDKRMAEVFSRQRIRMRAAFDQMEAGMRDLRAELAILDRVEEPASEEDPK